MTQKFDLKHKNRALMSSVFLNASSIVNSTCCNDAQIKTRQHARYEYIANSASTIFLRSHHPVPCTKNVNKHHMF